MERRRFLKTAVGTVVGTAVGAPLLSVPTAAAALLPNCKVETDPVKKTCYFRWFVYADDRVRHFSACSPDDRAEIAIDDRDFPRGRIIPLNEFMKILRSPEWEVFHVNYSYRKCDREKFMAHPFSIAEYAEVFRIPSNLITDTSECSSIYTQTACLLAGDLSY